MTLHAGVLGTGDWCRVHLAALTASPHVERVTLAGRNARARSDLAAEFSIVTQTAADHRALLDDASIDVIHVVLPHDLHAPRTIEALSAGKHVICEKPGATRLEDLDRAIATAAASDRRLLIVMNRLYWPTATKMRELVTSGAVGRPFLSVENSFTSAPKNYRDLGYWRNTPDRAGGGVLIDGGFHMVYRHLDTLAALGTPQWVLADTSQLAVREDGQRVESKGEDFVAIVVGYACPLRIEWAHGWTLAANPQRARQSFLAGTQGTLELTDRAETPLVIRRSHGTEERIEVETEPHTGADTTHACLLDYLACLAEGRQPQHGSLALARLTLATILAAYESSRLGRRVEISTAPSA